VFFSRCTLRCIYCQNYRWSQGGAGTAYGAAALAGILAELRSAGCHNWNLVSPTPWLPMIEEAVESLGGTGGRLPFVFNTSGYERVETLRRYARLADVYLADLRYASRATAWEGSGAEDYVPVAREALTEMWRQAGPVRTDGAGAAVKGLICRLLILPGRSDEAIEGLEWLARHLGPRVAVSVMAQYVPTHEAVGREPWGRRIRRDEYRQVCEAVERLGLTEGWVQEFDESPTAPMAGFAMGPGRGVVADEATRGDEGRGV
jgi:putative pyruvate formate lyase activating enzyme